MHGIDKTWILFVHLEFFKKVLFVDKSMNDHILAEKIALARVISSGIDWRDLYFNDLLWTFIHEILDLWGLENIISETFLEDLELLFAYAEIH